MVECVERIYDVRNVKRNDEDVGQKEVEVLVEVQVPGVFYRHHLLPVVYLI